MAPNIESPEDRLAFNRHLHDVATQESIVRSKQSRVQVLISKANANPDRYQEHADAAVAEMREAQEKLDELNETTANWGKDLSGTRNTLSDRFGNFARNAEVARAGGIGVEGSNSTESGDPADDPDEAGIQTMNSQPVVMGRGGQPETLTGDPVTVEQVTGDEEETSTTRKRGSKAASRRRAREQGSGDEE